MTVLFRCRVDPRLLERADQVTAALGTSTPEMFRVFLAEIARSGRIPVSLNTAENAPLNADIAADLVLRDTWEKIGPAPDIDYAQLASA